MTHRFRPVDHEHLVNDLVEAILARQAPGPALRVVVDGPLIADPHGLADALTGPLRAAGREVLRIRAETFWRDASVRLEYGHHDVESRLHGWLDVDTLQREVLRPLGPGGSGRWLPSLRDPATNRSTREPTRHAPPGAVLLLSGELLLGQVRGELNVHLAVSSGARARQVPQADSWLLEAYDRHDAGARPAEQADVLIRADHPTRLAVATRAATG